MASRSSHHFVPQFYFRNFSSDGRRIHLLNKGSGHVVENASIRHQCARRKFYVADDIEEIFSRLEATHSCAIRQCMDIAQTSTSNEIEASVYVEICRAALFQRARTIHEAEKHAPAHEQMYLEWFKLHLLNEGKQAMHDKLIEAERAGQVTVTADRRQIAALIISTLMEQTKMVFDLELHLIRNKSDYPFIFGDAPTVFYNSHLRLIKDRGVLGLQTPGLQIFYPLSSSICMMLIDERRYTGRFLDEVVIDVTSRSDISQLNALQLHNSSENIYFGHWDDRDYVTDLWQSHRSSCNPVKAQYAKRWMCIDDDPQPKEGFLYFEPQLDFELDLSFITTKPLPTSEFRSERRCPELAAFLGDDESDSEMSFTP